MRTPAHQQQPWRPRKVPPPPQPVFPLSPPLSPEMKAEGEEAGAGKGKGKESEGESEEEQLRRALEASMRDQKHKNKAVERTDSDEELAKALAESRALEQRRSTYEAQEQNDLEAALLASQHEHAKPPTPPSDPSPTSSSGSSNGGARHPTLYRPRSASLPTFSPSDLSYPPSSFPAEKSRHFPELRPALPPGAAGAWDDESREMEMLAVAIRISEEEERERERIERMGEEEALRRVREAEREVLARGKARGSEESAEDAGRGTYPSTAFASSVSLAPTAAPITPATTLSSSTTSDKSASVAAAAKDAKDKKRSSWFRPPLASKLSSSSGPPPSPSPPKSPAPAPAQGPAAAAGAPRPPPLASGAQHSSAASVQTFRTARESLPFTNFDPAPPAPEPAHAPVHAAAATKPPSPRVLRKQSRPPVPPHPLPLSSAAAPPPPRPTRLPPTPPETPQTGSAAVFQPQQQSQPAQKNAPFLPPTQSHPTAAAAAAASDRFREEYNGSPVEMPYLTPSRSSSLIASGNGSGGRSVDDHLRVRTTSGAAAFSVSGGSAHSHAHSHGSRSGHVGGSGGGGGGSDESADGADETASVLAVRNPDPAGSEGGHALSSASATSGSCPSDDDGDGDGTVEGAGEGGENASVSAHSYVSEGDAYGGMDVDHFSSAMERYPAFPEDADAVEALWQFDHPHQQQHQQQQQPFPLPLPGRPDTGGGGGPGGRGPYFESAYAGRSMSAIDEMTEPASSVVGTSVVGTDGGGGGGEKRQGSFPSTLGGGSGLGDAGGEVVGEGLWFGGVGGAGGAFGDGSRDHDRDHDLVPFPTTASPVSSLARPSSRPTMMRRGSSSSSSASLTASRSGHGHGHGHFVPSGAGGLGYSPSLSHQQQQQFQHAAWPGLSSPNLALSSPPLFSHSSSSQQQQHHQALPNQSHVSVASAYTAATTVPAPSFDSPTASSTGHGPLPVVPPTQPALGVAGGAAPPAATTPPLAAPAEEGLRFGYPSHCARAPGHSCPSDGLSTTTTSSEPVLVPTLIELSSPSPLPAGLGLRLDEAPAPRDAWAVEARSWVALVRFLLWHGDVSLAASAEDAKQSPSGRCAAEARLEFRPDDEGGEVVRLVVELVRPEEALARLARHRELSVEYPVLSSSSAEHGGGGKGKGKARAAPAAPSSKIATFSLPDVLHLPTRLSSLAIQLYTLRHLASIARATQPSRSPPPPAALALSASANGASSTPAVEGYPALRALADSINALARAAAERDQPAAGSGAGTGASGSFFPSPSGDRTPRAAQTSGGRPTPAPAQQPEEQNQRLVDRLRERLRRLKRHAHGGGDENAPPAPVPSSSAAAAAAQVPPGLASSAAFYQLPAHAQQQQGAKRSSKLVKPPPPPRTQLVPRSERVLSAAQTIRSGEVGDEGGILGVNGSEEVLGGERRSGEEARRVTSREEEERWEVVDRPRGRRTSTQSQMRYLPEI
ncbi:hypothetical protein JCM6882_008903 [Rhodosporidiobolus microsporus]